MSMSFGRCGECRNYRLLIKDAKCHSCLPTFTLRVTVETPQKIHKTDKIDIKEYKRDKMKDAFRDWYDNESRTYVEGYTFKNVDELIVHVNKKRYKRLARQDRISKTCDAIHKEVMRAIRNA